MYVNTFNYHTTFTKKYIIDNKNNKLNTKNTILKNGVFCYRLYNNYNNDNLYLYIDIYIYYHWCWFPVLWRGFHRQLRDAPGSLGVQCDYLNPLECYCIEKYNYCYKIFIMVTRIK